jgi:hypothetical protein
MVMRRTTWLFPLCALLLVGCSDSSGPGDEQKTDEELQFVRFPVTPPIAQLQASFWAVAGEERRLEIDYLPLQVGEDGEDFLEFRVPEEGLLRRPDGSAFAPGDSVLITITVSPDGRFLFDFQPSGLVFNPEHPARLKVDYSHTDDDLNGDGDVDDDDFDLDARLRVWKQELPGTPWVPVGTVRIEDFDEIEGVISSFTGFCIAG